MQYKKISFPCRKKRTLKCRYARNSLFSLSNKLIKIKDEEFEESIRYSTRQKKKIRENVQ